jgi:misacylated tRNA(Ala) deacylase
MTTRLYWNDPYIKEFNAEIENIAANTVVLDQTAFYPGGGGQPNDLGTIEIGGKKFMVIGMVSDKDSIVHNLDGTPEAKKGDAVKGIINWDRRYVCMKYHTTLHIIDAIAEKKYGIKPTGNQIYVDRARIDFDMPEMDKKFAEKLTAEANEVIKRGYAVVAKDLPKAEALKIPDLVRTEPGRQLVSSMDHVRVIEIVGFDAQADGGTHVANTSEIGAIALTKLENKGSHNKRLEITISQ